jgi:hypothetical protein
MVVVLLPLDSFDGDRLERWIARVERLTDSQYLWNCPGGDGTEVLVLVFGRNGAWRERWSRWSARPGRLPTELPKGSAYRLPRRTAESRMSGAGSGATLDARMTVVSRGWRTVAWPRPLW